MYALREQIFGKNGIYSSTKNLDFYLEYLRAECLDQMVSWGEGDCLHAALLIMRGLWSFFAHDQSEISEPVVSKSIIQLTYIPGYKRVIFDKQIPCFFSEFFVCL